MIPIFMKMHIREKNKNKIRLYFPLICIWILMAAIMIALSPLILIAALISWPLGYGRSLLLIGPRLLTVIGALSGLVVQVEGSDEKVYIYIK
jgi:hypothetical protein